MKTTPLLGVNVDHVATLRQARETRYPDPVKAALDAEEAGADGITVHLREDRRHIQERDLLLLKELLQTRMNFEMGISQAMLAFAEQICPHWACFVPETRQELTTEGGLDLTKQPEIIRTAVQRLNNIGCQVSLFIDADEEQIAAAWATGAAAIELHTGRYADAQTVSQQKQELLRIIHAAKIAQEHGLIVNAGHGLHYHNVSAIAAIQGIHELNIGHSIVAQALFVGFKQAVRDMKALLMHAARPM